MLKSILRTTLFAGCCLLGSHALQAQEVVHALTGTVNTIDAAAKTFSITADDGSGGVFDQAASSHKSQWLEKAIRNGAVAAGGFNQTGAHVIVYYLGWGSPRTAVAFQALGAGPFTTTIGTVVKFDKGDRTLSIKEASGTVDSFKIFPDSVAETGIGAIEGLKFDPTKSERVRVTATPVNGTEKALFIYAAFAN
jgi:hypothetical protein